MNPAARKHTPMDIKLTVTDGPHQGTVFKLSGHDTFLVGRSKHAHLKLPSKDKYFSRIHFMVEVNPPQCRLIDMGSHNGTYVNGQKVAIADLRHGDQIRAGRTVLNLEFEGEPDQVESSETVSPPPPTIEWPRQDGKLVPVPQKLVATSKLYPTFPGYVIERELGRGGMGVVYLAKRLADDSKVALKTITPNVMCNKLQVARFLNEAKILEELQHPFIVRFRDLGEIGELIYFAMDYVEGTDAHQVLKSQGPMIPERAVRLTGQLLQALEYAHGRGFVHRDIKPANLLLTVEEGFEVVKLADFGLARVYQASQLSGLTMTGEIGGTAAFMPPEQLTNYRQAKPAADQYAAAATLYSLLTGTLIYDMPKELHEQFAMILNEDAVPIQMRKPDISPLLAKAIHKALAREPEDRYPTVAEFRRAILGART